MRDPSAKAAKEHRVRVRLRTHQGSTSLQSVHHRLVRELRLLLPIQRAKQRRCVESWIACWLRRVLSPIARIGSRSLWSPARSRRYVAVACRCLEADTGFCKGARCWWKRGQSVAKRSSPPFPEPRTPKIRSTKFTVQAIMYILQARSHNIRDSKHGIQITRKRRRRTSALSPS